MSNSGSQCVVRGSRLQFHAIWTSQLLRQAKLQKMLSTMGFSVAFLEAPLSDDEDDEDMEEEEEEYHEARIGF